MKISLEEWMKKNGKTLIKFSEELGCNHQSLIAWKKGRRTPHQYYRKLLMKLTNNQVDI